MRGMILAAGRGQRMGELTDRIPKPLLPVAGRYLIEYAISSFIRASIHEIVINVCYCAEQIKTALGDGKRYGATFIYSEEKERLETGGGIFQALPLLGEAPFLVMSSDIITDYALEMLPREPEGLAHLVVVDNPSFHPRGDFGLCESYLDMDAKPTFTFANIGIFRPQLFTDCKLGYFPLNQLLFPAVRNKLITAEHYKKIWYNVGTPEQLKKCNQALSDSPFQF